MTIATASATIADLEQHPGRCELIDGEIIDMAPAGFEHGRTMLRIGHLLLQHVETKRLPGVVLAGDPGFILDDHNVRAPDVAYVDAERARLAPARGYMRFVPNLAVEVVSPGDTYSDVVSKARMWLASGVSLVWVADPWAQTIAVYRSGHDIVQLAAGDHLDGGEVLPGFSCAVAECFT